MPRISVVIPVYNSAKFLRECIESLLNQTETDCEFIFVNDGSTDESREIIESYREKDSRIHIIDQPNQGVSVARNKGIATAGGEFLAFVDADDTIAPQMFETLLQLLAATSSDVVCSGFIYEQDGHQLRLDMPFEKNKPFGREFISKEVIPYMLRYDSLNSVANKMYRRAPITENQISFPQGQTLGEDALFNFKAFGSANQVVFTDYAGYFYREVTGSATRNILDKNYFKTALEVYAADIALSNEIHIDAETMQRLKGLRLIDKVVSYCAIYHKPGTLPFKNRYDYISQMISHPVVSQNVKLLWTQLLEGKSVFAKIILYCIRYRLTPFLWLAYSYSYHRNKK
jgi:glycosyltransferase involved in cell wall biosynthesis